MSCAAPLGQTQTDMKEEMKMEAVDAVVSAIEKFGNHEPDDNNPACKTSACRPLYLLQALMQAT